MTARKYDQKGYLEGESRDRRVGRGARPERQGPGGRGLGRPTSTRFTCARCGAEAETRGEIGTEQVCASCGSALHSCTNCRHFDTSARFECRAGVAERIASKSGRNACELFEPRAVQDHGADGGGEDDAKAAFDALFDF